MIVEKILAEKAGKIKRSPCKSNRASSLGYFVPELDGCLRRGVYERTHWQEKELHDANRQLVFDEGNNHEKQFLLDCAAAGVQIIEQQTAFSWDVYEITGHLDGIILDGNQVVPVEFKSMSPNIYPQINSFEDFKKKPWTRAYMAQIQIYMLSKNVSRALFVLKNKSTGELKEVEVLLDYELAEACIKTAEQINRHIKENTLPEKITDREKCRECPFKTTCWPEINFGVELKIADDPELESRIDRMIELEEAGAEHDEIEKIVKTRAKASAADGALNIIVGKYRLTGKTGGNGFRLKIERI